GGRMGGARRLNSGRRFAGGGRVTWSCRGRGCGGLTATRGSGGAWRSGARRSRSATGRAASTSCPGRAERGPGGPQGITGSKMSSVSPPRRPPAAGTVITRDRLAHARALAESFARHHPRGRFYLLVVDGLPAGTVAGAGAVLLGLNDLATPHLLDLAGAQHPGELCTLAKPALLRLLTDRYGEEVVVLFDPAVLVARPLTELADLARSAGGVLAPQLLRPPPPPRAAPPA